MKRYETAQQIIHNMDRAKSDSERLVKIADSLEIEAKRLLQIPEMVEHGKYKLKTVHAYRTRAKNLTTSRIDHLKHKLAEFQTMLLPNIGVEDTSISTR